MSICELIEWTGINKKYWSNFLFWLSLEFFHFSWHFTTSLSTKTTGWYCDARSYRWVTVAKVAQILPQGHVLVLCKIQPWFGYIVKFSSDTEGTYQVLKGHILRDYFKRFSSQFTDLPVTSLDALIHWRAVRAGF